MRDLASSPTAKNFLIIGPDMRIAGLDQTPHDKTTVISHEEWEKIPDRDQASPDAFYQYCLKTIRDASAKLKPQDEVRVIVSSHGKMTSGGDGMTEYSLGTGIHPAKLDHDLRKSGNEGEVGLGDRPIFQDGYGCGLGGRIGSKSEKEGRSEARKKAEDRFIREGLSEKTLVCLNAGNKAAVDSLNDHAVLVVLKQLQDGAKTSAIIARKSENPSSNRLIVRRDDRIVAAGFHALRPNVALQSDTNKPVPIHEQAKEHIIAIRTAHRAFLKGVNLDDDSKDPGVPDKTVSGEGVDKYVDLTLHRERTYERTLKTPKKTERLKPYLVTNQYAEPSFVVAGQEGDIPFLEERLKLDPEAATKVLKSTGQSAISRAAENGHSKAVELLLKHGAEPTLIPPGRKFTLLLNALKEKKFEIATTIADYIIEHKSHQLHELLSPLVEKYVQGELPGKLIGNIYKKLHSEASDKQIEDVIKEFKRNYGYDDEESKGKTRDFLNKLCSGKEMMAGVEKVEQAPTPPVPAAPTKPVEATPAASEVATTPATTARPAPATVQTPTPAPAAVQAATATIPTPKKSLLDIMKEAWRGTAVVTTPEASPTSLPQSAPNPPAAAARRPPRIARFPKATPKPEAPETSEAVRKSLESLLDPLNPLGKIDSPNKDGIHPIHLAAQYGFKDMVEQLAARGANINQPDKEGRTPLHYAAQYGHKGVAVFLVGENADVKSQDKQGRTALHDAAQYGHKGIAMILVAKGAEVNLQDNQGCSPLHEAAKNGQVGVRNSLKKAGGKMELEDAKGKTPKDYAIQYARERRARDAAKFMDDLLSPAVAPISRAPSPLDALTDDLLSANPIAVPAASPASSASARSDAASPGPATPPVSASRGSEGGEVEPNIAELEALLAKLTAARKPRVPETRETLEQAIEARDTKKLDAAIAHKDVDLNSLDKNGRTLLHTACGTIGGSQMAVKLLEAGADPRISGKGQFGEIKSPLYYAFANRDASLIEASLNAITRGANSADHGDIIFAALTKKDEKDGAPVPKTSILDQIMSEKSDSKKAELLSAVVRAIDPGADTKAKVDTMLRDAVKTPEKALYPESHLGKLAAQRGQAAASNEAPVMSAFRKLCGADSDQRSSVVTQVPVRER